MTTLQDIPNGSTVVVSAKKCHTMSKEIQEVMKDFTAHATKIDISPFLMALLNALAISILPS